MPRSIAGWPATGENVVGEGFIPSRITRGGVYPLPEIMKDLPKRKKIRLPHAAYCDGQVFFITIGTYERYPWFRLYPKFTDISMQLLREIAVSRKSKLYAWCFMPDHVHLLLRDTDVVQFVRLFKGKLAPAGSTFEPARRLWQRSFYDKGLRKEEPLEKVALYIWENPVRAGKVKSPTDYEWIGSGFWPDWKEMFGKG